MVFLPVIAMEVSSSPILLSIFLLICSLLICVWYIYWRKPEICEHKLRKQGIRGPPPSFLLGNIPQMKQMMAQKSASPEIDGSITVFPYFNKWTKDYGDLFRFRLGGYQLLYVKNIKIVKEIGIFRSMDLGKPAYLQNERGVLLGKGLITTNGTVWSYQRKTLTPHLYMDKVKGMLNIMVEAGCTLIRTWEKITEREGGEAEIFIDGHMRSFTADVTSKMVFGDDHHKGIHIFPKCKALINAMGGATTLGIPFSRFIPNKSNREAHRLAKEIQGIILDIAKERAGSASQDILQVILEASKNGELGPLTKEEFIVDNCKNVFLAAYEVNAIAAIWGLMLLASNPEWQDRARSEVLEVCGGQFPDYNMLGKMKVLKMVLLEALRLYPGVALVSRQALQDVKLGDMKVPKDVSIWIFLVALHRDPELWGADADTFNPGRFSNGVSGACKCPQAYIPFGVGPRTCPGQNLAMTQLKLLFAMVLSKFELKLSPHYRHSPKFGLLLEPEHGVNLLIQRI